MTRVQVLLAVYNGGAFLHEQLASIDAQSLESIDILAADDGSSDASMEILLDAQKRWTKGSFTIISGPQSGFARNFRHLILESNQAADHYAFCDQDDIWLPEKLERAISFCPNRSSDGACVFSSRTALVDSNGAPIGFSKIPARPPGFRNAILQNIASGNTMVMNKAARQLMVETAENIGPLSHDHWLYLITTASGGLFHYDPAPTVLYRQHENNAIGYSTMPFWKKFAWRFDRYTTGAVRRLTAQQIAAMENCSDHLTDDSKRVLRDCKIIHSNDSVIKRIKALRSSGIYRNLYIGQIGLWVDCLFKLR